MKKSQSFSIDIVNKEAIKSLKGEGDWEHTYRDEYLVMYRIGESLFRMPEKNITLYVIYTGIRKGKMEIFNKGFK